MDDLNISNHIAIASEAFLQVVMVLARILMGSAAAAFGLTVIGIIWLCLEETRQVLPAKARAGEPGRAPRKAIHFPVSLGAESQRPQVSLSAQHRRA